MSVAPTNTRIPTDIEEHFHYFFLTFFQLTRVICHVFKFEKSLRVPNDDGKKADMWQTLGQNE